MVTKPQVDLDGMTYQELTTLVENARTMRDAKQGEARAALITEFKQRAGALGMSFDELRPVIGRAAGGRKARSDAGVPVAAKFRGPEGATWSGRGRKPGWLTKLEAEGKNAEDFRI